MRQTVKVQYSFLSIGAVSTIQFPEVSLWHPTLLTPCLCPGNLLMTQQLVTISSDLLRSSLAPEPRSWLLGLGFRWHWRQCAACCWRRQCCEEEVACCCGLLWTLQPPVGGVTRLCPPLLACSPTYATHSVCSPSLHTKRGLTLLHTQAWGYWHYKYWNKNKTSESDIMHQTQHTGEGICVLKPYSIKLKEL